MVDRQRAVVSGGSGGIGGAVARELLRRGYDVDLWYRSNQEAVEKLRQETSGLDGGLTAQHVDVTDPEAVRKAVGAVERVDLFVHAAGTIVRPAAWNEATDEGIRETIEVNLTSALWVARATLPRMMEQGSGHLMLLSSAYAVDAGAAAVLAYTAAKAGLTAVTRGLAAEVGARGVRVNAVAPSNVDTAMTHSAGPEVVQWAVSTTPVGRLADVAEVAQLILAVHDNAYLTGGVIVLDGGQSLMI